jgi:branched-chain amino acid transport system permease protein
MIAALDDVLWTYQHLVHAIGINGLMALSMYVVMAAGQLSLGQAAFMGLGAYTAALLTLSTNLPFAAVLALACLVPVAFALVIGGPTLRLSGVYLAIATIGLGEVLRAVYLNLDAVGGALGLSGIPHRANTALIYSILAVTALLLWLIARSRIGRAMEAMREDETAAAVIGVNVWRYKMGVLVASAVLAGIAGALQAHVSSFISPNEYGFEAAVTILSFVLLGGLGTPLAPIVGALILTALPELLRGFSDLRLILNGAIIVLAVLYLPRGLLSWRMARRLT